jgi:hypothetical protein
LTRDGREERRRGGERVEGGRMEERKLEGKDRRKKSKREVKSGRMKEGESEMARQQAGREIRYVFKICKLNSTIWYEKQYQKSVQWPITDFLHLFVKFFVVFGNTIIDQMDEIIVQGTAESGKGISC